MKPILLAAFPLLLLLILCCSPVRKSRHISSGLTNRPLNNTHAEPLKNFITGIVKDSLENQPLPFVTVELYWNNHREEPLLTTTTSPRGKFSFALANGDYLLIISHNRFKEREVIVAVKGWDIDLPEIRLSPLFD